MARKTKALTATPVTVNAIDKLIEKLNELDGIEFAKDAWVDKAPEVYGVVTLAGEPRQLWADGHLIDSIWQVGVHAYVDDDSDAWPERIQQKLEELESAGKVDLTHSITREFDYEVGKVHWQWLVMMYSPLTWTE